LDVGLYNEFILSRKKKYEWPKLKTVRYYKKGGNLAYLQRIKRIKALLGDITLSEMNAHYTL
jgi:hypothetical protein